MKAPGSSLEAVRTPEQAAALFHPTRRELLSRLAEPDSAAGLSRRLGIPRQRINYHLRELEREGLVELVEERRKGNCTERVVRATARSWVISPEALGALGESQDAATDRYSASYLIAAAARVVKDVASLEQRARDRKKRLATLSLHAAVRFASAESRAAFAEELASAVAALCARYHDETVPRGREFRVVAFVHPAPVGPGGGHG